VVALVAIYLPFFATTRGATWGLAASTITTSAWYLLNNPFGIDNMYIALATPALVILLERCLPAARNSTKAEVSNAN
jgi:SSS family solute:Na+ symporter